MNPQQQSAIGEFTLGKPLGTFRALLILNMVLLVILGAVTFGARVQAQNRVRGEYTMVAGGVNGSNADAVYIIDATNQEMFAVIYDYNQKLLNGMGYRNLAADAATYTRPAAVRSSK